MHVPHTRPSGGWVCVYTHLISALKMLLFLCTVSELDSPAPHGNDTFVLAALILF